LWSAVRAKKLNSTEILNLFLTSKGWLEVKSDHSTQIRCG
jgi:hypothetical protein